MTALRWAAPARRPDRAGEGMSAAAQVVVVVIAATVFLARLVAALYRAHADGRIAARRARQERQP